MRPGRERVMHREVDVAGALFQEECVECRAGQRIGGWLRQRTGVGAPEHPLAVWGGDVVKDRWSGFRVVGGRQDAHVVRAELDPVTGAYLTEARPDAVGLHPLPA